jgi:hypothetical protein
MDQEISPDIVIEDFEELFDADTVAVGSEEPDADSAKPRLSDAGMGYD